MVAYTNFWSIRSFFILIIEIIDSQIQILKMIL